MTFEKDMNKKIIEKGVSSFDELKAAFCAAKENSANLVLYFASGKYSELDEEEIRWLTNHRSEKYGVNAVIKIKKPDESRLYPAASVLDMPSNIDVDAVELLLAKEIAKSRHKIVVLDDDPTGVQTVHDVSVYTEWSSDCIEAGFAEKNKLFYMLTNSRNMLAEESERVHRLIAKRVAAESKISGVPFILISRSDSTLRGHYPLETETLRQTLEKEGYIIDGEIFCPFFAEGGRFTLGDVHYVRMDNELVPVAETEFARSADFAYEHSLLPAYIEEKTKGKYKEKDVISISLESLRAMDYENIEEKLLSASGFAKVCVNALCEDDLKVFSVAFYRALAKGHNFIFRSAAGLVKVIAGISTRPLLFRSNIIQENNMTGGIIIAGTHTQKSMTQIKALETLETVEYLPVNTECIMKDENSFLEEVSGFVSKAEKLIKSGKTPVCYLEQNAGWIERVVAGNFMQQLICKLTIKPAFVISKGGVETDEIAVKALRIKKAVVLGEVLPGVPVLKTSPRSRFPNIPYIIFPDNVGEDTALRTVVETLYRK